MPSKRMPRRKFNRRRNSRRAPSNKALNNKIKKIQKDVELKFKDTYFTADVSTTATANLLNSIDIGTTNRGERIGNYIKTTSLQMRMTISPDIANLLNTQIRVIAFWDKQANGAAPILIGGSNTASLLDTTTITDALFAPINWNYSDRYRVLYDKTIILNGAMVLDFDPATGTTSQMLADSRYLSKKIKLSRSVKYDGTTAGIADIATNSLYVMYVGDIAAGGNNPQIEFSSRVYYKDS